MTSRKPSGKSQALVSFGSSRPAFSQFVYGKWLSLAFMVVFGSLGTYWLLAGNADSTLADCASATGTAPVVHGSTLPYRAHYCTFTQTAPVYSGNAEVGTLPAGRSWVLCEAIGSIYPSPAATVHSTVWAYTEANTGSWGWVNAANGAGVINNHGFRGVPACSTAFMASEHSYPPGYVPSP